MREGFSTLATVKGLKTPETLRLKKEIQDANYKKLSVALIQNKLKVNRKKAEEIFDLTLKEKEG